MKKLINSLMMALFTFILLITSLYAWFTTNQTASVNEIKINSKTSLVKEANLNVFRGKLVGTEITLDTTSNSLELPPYDMLASDENNCLILKLDIVTTDYLDTLFDFRCTQPTYSSEIYEENGNEVKSYYNYLSNIINFDTVEYIEDSYIKQSVEGHQFIDIEDGLIDVDHKDSIKTLPLSKDNLRAVEDSGDYIGTYYFIIHYNEDAIIYFFSKNLTSLSQEVYFRSDLNFSIRGVA